MDVYEHILSEFMSNKADGKGPTVKRKEKQIEYPGKYLSRTDREALKRQRCGRAAKRTRRYMTVTVLLLWDGLLLYMIVKCLIDGVYGAVFMAVISVTMGYHMK